MSIKVEDTLSEIRYAGGYVSALPVTTTATGTFGAISASSQTVTGAFAINGNATVGGTLGVTGAVSIVGALGANGALTVGGAATVTGALTAGATGTSPAVTFGTGGPAVIAGTLAPPANPTGITAALGTLFINLGATGVTNRVYINTNGATGWTFLGTSGA